MVSRIIVITAMVLAAAAAFAYLVWDGTIRFNTPSREAFPVRGVDVSHHQGLVDWTRVRSSGIDFAYIKASEGGDWRDPAFDANWRDASAAGLPRGAYHFFTLCTPGDEQAKAFIAAVGEDTGELPPVIDAEFVGNCNERPAVKDVGAELSVMVERVRQRFGRPPVLYVTYEFYDLYMSDQLLDAQLWIRDIWRHPHLRAGRDWLFWQFHNHAAVDGITGPVDLNVFNGGREAFEELAEMPGPETDLDDEPLPEPMDDDDDDDSPPVKKPAFAPDTAPED